MTTEADKLAEALHRRIHECDCSDDRSRCGSCLNDLGLLVAHDIHRVQGDGKVEAAKDCWVLFNAYGFPIAVSTLEPLSYNKDGWIRMAPAEQQPAHPAGTRAESLLQAIGIVRNQDRAFDFTDTRDQDVYLLGRNDALNDLLRIARELESAIAQQEEKTLR